MNGEVTSLVGQWLQLHAPNAGGMGSMPGQGTRSYILQLIVLMLQLKISHAETKKKKKEIYIYPTCHNQKILHTAMKIKDPTCHD